MKLLRILILAATVLPMLTLQTPRAAAAQAISVEEHDRLWGQAMAALLRFVDTASPETGALTADLEPLLNAERMRFNSAIAKLALASSPAPTVPRQLIIVPICQEIATVMSVLTDSVRAGDGAGAEAARRWLGDRLIDLRLALWKLDNSSR